MERTAMLYTERKQLTIMKLNKDDKSISISELMVVLLEYPSNIIYCEVEEVLIGIISLGDILRGFRNGQNRVCINREFTSLCQNKSLNARIIFKEKKNINALPIITEDRKLIGDYTRWDDLIALEYEMNYGIEYNIDNCKNRQNIMLVCPNSIFKNRLRIFKKFKRYLEYRGGLVTCINLFEVKEYLNRADMILFVDENEIRACITLLMIEFDGEFNGRDRLKTYKDLIEDGRRIKDEQVTLYLTKLLNKGIKIIGLIDVESAYGKYLRDITRNRFADIGETPSGIPPKAMYKDFFDDLYSDEYVKDILEIPYTCEFNRGVLRFKDYKSQYYNVIDGERITINQPEQFEKSIYFYGPCYIYGHLVEDKNTIESYLQNYICHKKQEIRVVNYGCLGYDINAKYLPRIVVTPLKVGDILVIDRPPRNIEGIYYLDLVKVLENNNVNIKWLTDAWMHCNHKVNEIYANAIYDVIESGYIEDVKGKGELIDKEENFIKFLYLDRYFSKFDSSKYNKIGSIVMNCNPFTLGHRYLIEQALITVNFLIIFVVEEDKSFFSYHERFAMVKEGVADLDNVMVVPSGPFILSQLSFPEYFVKETSRDLRAHTEQDIITFAEKIASQLGITYRFVGEEPEDEITNQYNMTMKKILPQYNIEYIEISRKMSNGRYISASSVRKYMEKNDKTKFAELLPKTTRRLLGIE